MVLPVRDVSTVVYVHRYKWRCIVVFDNQLVFIWTNIMRAAVLSDLIFLAIWAVHLQMVFSLLSFLISSFGLVDTKWSDFTGSRSAPIAMTSIILLRFLMSVIYDKIIRLLVSTFNFEDKSTSSYKIQLWNCVCFRRFMSVIMNRNIVFFTKFNSVHTN